MCNTTIMKEQQPEQARTQMRKGVLEFCIMLIIARDKAYATEILQELQLANLLVVEGTLYPLLSRLKTQGYLAYTWEESKTGPPRKYYTLTAEGKKNLVQLKELWKELTNSINALLK